MVDDRLRRRQLRAVARRIPRWMPGPVFLRGEDVTLRTVEEEDLPFLRETVDDPAVRADLPDPGTPVTADRLRERQEELADDDAVDLLVCAGGERAGNVALADADRRHGVAEIGLLLAPAHHGRGLGTEASALVTGYGFDELRLHRVEAQVLAGNEASMRIWEKLGYEHEGVRREAAFVGGEHLDLHVYGVLAGEWREDDTDGR